MQPIKIREPTTIPTTRVGTASRCEDTSYFKTDSQPRFSYPSCHAEPEFYDSANSLPPTTMPLPRQDTARSTGSTASTTSISAGRQPQVINGRYLDAEKLKAYLRSKYGNQWKVQVKPGGWVVTAPEKIPPVRLTWRDSRRAADDCRRRCSKNYQPRCDFVRNLQIHSIII